LIQNPAPPAAPPPVPASAEAPCRAAATAQSRRAAARPAPSHRERGRFSTAKMMDDMVKNHRKHGLLSNEP